ncbi:MAG: hydrogenase/urease accessory protein HupE [Saprospiraceae bacterium]|jgi:hydrogenase/urease accessory protein HupE
MLKQKEINFIWLLLLLPLWSVAHESRPLYIQFTEVDSSVIKVKLNIPNSVREDNLPYIIFPNSIFESEDTKIVKTNPSGYVIEWQVQQIEGDLRGSIFGISYPKFNPAITSLVRVAFADGAEQTIIIGPEQAEFRIPETPSSWTVANQYTSLGYSHIWAGLDHLLFVACLLFIADFGRKLLFAITGFTFAHSITLALSALDVINVHIAPVEACIALSVLFLCYEIANHKKGEDSLTYRYPVLVSSSFGLLHGLGFAAVLGEIGLPNASKIIGLLFFNLGVEIGQLVFILALFILYYIGMKVIERFGIPNVSGLALRVGVYGVGITSAYWFFDRLF